MPTVTDLWDTVSKSFKPLSPVHYGFRLQDWKGAPWHIRRVELVEALSEPYRLTLELVVDESRLDLDALLGDTCTLELDRDASSRAIHGIVLAADDLGRAAGRHHVRLEIGPALALLVQQIDTRAWQDVSAVDILKLVLTAPLTAFGRSVDSTQLRAADYPKREYCVQFRESDLAFAARLMEEEGITYRFDHQGDAERLVLIDDNHDFAAQQSDPLEIVGTEPETAHTESIQRFSMGRRLCSTAVTQRNFDWQTPEAPHAATRSGQDLRGRTREIYEHDDVVYPGDGVRHARIKQERLAVGGHAVSGSSNATSMTPGVWFSLHGHADPELDGKYLVIRTVHRGESPDATVLVVDLQAAGPRYFNEFECIPLAVPFRPQLRQPRPRVSGLQTAIVTGPPGEEVHCDEFGRIKILPHWDRVSPRDETSSFWVRVAQSVAGGAWGMFALPRVGMEVVVDFLDGDPDRPLVVGCVYNGRNGTPYSLPAEKTKTTIKSSSSPGGAGSNELRFEDQAGAEELYLHAQMTFNAVVGADMSLSVGGSESDSISANRNTTVGANDTTTVGANSDLTVGANITSTAGANHAASAAATQSFSAGASQSLSAGSGQSLSSGTTQSFSAGTSQSVTIGTAQSVSIGTDQQICVTNNRLLDVGLNDVQKVGADAEHTVTGSYKQMLATDAKLSTGTTKQEQIGSDYTLQVGGSQVSMITGVHLELVQTQLIAASTGIGLVCGGTHIIIKDGEIKIFGAGEVEINGGGTTKIIGGEVSVEGGSVTINGGSGVSISGGTVKLN